MSLDAKVVQCIFAGAVRFYAASVRWAGRLWVWCAFMMVIQMVCQTEALAINKCIVGGQITYQDVPCEEEQRIVVQEAPRKEHNAVLHRKLDRLAAQGYGMVQQLPAPVAPPVGSEWKERTLRTNAESIAALTRVLDDAAKSCGGKLIDYPAIGMSDETFRKCTTHARFGGATQVVISEDGKVPLRLYIFPTERAGRVYSIGGVITAIRP